MRLLKSYLLRYGAVVWVSTPDAWAHLKHYLSNSDLAYRFRVQKMIDEVPDASRAFDGELAEAMRFVEDNLQTGAAYITSGSVISPSNPRSQSLNWYLAVAGYKAWGKGLASVSCDGTYVLEFEYNVFDRYNFDGGKNADIHLGLNVKDEIPAAFHLQGLAKEFDLIGTVRKTVSWKRGGIAVVENGWESEGSRDR